MQVGSKYNRSPNRFAKTIEILGSCWLGYRSAQVRFEQNTVDDTNCFDVIGFEAAHDDVRLAVDAPSVGYRRGSFPRPLTIYAGSLESVPGWRADFSGCSRCLLGVDCAVVIVARPLNPSGSVRHYRSKRMELLSEAGSSVLPQQDFRTLFRPLVRVGDYRQSGSSDRS